MATFRFLHAADVHLDSPLVGLNRYESAPVEAARSATRRAFENLVRLAIDEEVAFVLLAGDLYDGDWKDYRTGLFFVEQMARLRDAKIPVFIVAGNHDAASQLTKSLRPPENVRFFATKEPERVVIDSYDVAIAGQGFATRAVTADLSSAYPTADPALFNIGLLHTSLDGRVGHEPYAPTSVSSLAQKGYQYWALGHVHTREIVARDPWIVFPGNLQGRHARETGAKGCSLVTVTGGAVREVEARCVDVLRWAVCHVEIEGAESSYEVLDRVAGELGRVCEDAEGKPVAIRVEIVGSAGCHDEISADPERWTHEVRALATASSAGDVWVEKVHFALERPIDLDAALSRGDALGGLLREVAAAADNPDELDVLREALADLRKAVKTDLQGGDERFDLNEPEVLTRLIAEARDLLLARLVREGST